MIRPSAKTSKVQKDELLSEVSSSSMKNRNFFIAALGTLLYVQTIVAGTTDLQILILNNGIRLPFININIPLMGFYIVVPLFVLGIHFNLLQNLENHLQKLRKLNRQYRNTVPRHLIQPFFFDLAILQQSGVFVGFVRLFSIILVLWFAPITLLMILWRMADYQSFDLTLWHACLFTLDVFFVRRFYTSLYLEQTRKKKWFQKITAGLSLITGFWRYNETSRFGSFIIGLITFSTFFLTTFQLFNIYIIQNHDVFLADLITDITSACIDRVEEFSLSHYPISRKFIKHISVVIQGKEVQLTINSNHPELDKIDNFLRPTIDLIAPLLPIGESFNHFRIRCQLNGQNNLQSCFKNIGTPLNLTNRMLKGANLRYSDLRYADLSGAQLQGAMLSNALLNHANFYKANLEGASLVNTRLDYSNFSGAILIQTFFGSSHLPDAAFDNADLQGAQFYSSDLQRADFYSTQSQGAIFKNSNLQFADFSDSNLTGASFTDNQMQVTDFNQSNLSGSLIKGNTLCGSLISSSNIISGSTVIYSDLFSKPSTSDWKGLRKIANTRDFKSPLVHGEEVKDYYSGKSLLHAYKVITQKCSYPPELIKMSSSPEQVAEALIPALCPLTSSNQAALSNILYTYSPKIFPRRIRVFDEIHGAFLPPPPIYVHAFNISSVRCAISHLITKYPSCQKAIPNNDTRTHPIDREKLMFIWRSGVSLFNYHLGQDPGYIYWLNFNPKYACATKGG